MIAEASASNQAMPPAWTVSRVKRTVSLLNGTEPPGRLREPGHLHRRVANRPCARLRYKRIGLDAQAIAFLTRDPAAGPSQRRDAP